MFMPKRFARPLAIGSVLSAGVISGAVAVAIAAPGALDLGFGSGGALTTPIGPDLFDGAFGVAVQPDGKIVAAGLAATGPAATGDDFALVRYLPDGTLDPGFGAGGKVTTPITPGTAADGAQAVVLQPDGKIVAGGYTYPSGGGERRFALARYLPGGTLDPSFGAGGKVVTDIGFVGGGEDVVNALALQPDGKIVAAGRATMASGYSDPDLALARYNPDGGLDPTFDGDGVVTTAIAPTVADFENVAALAIQPDGKIVAGGSAVMGATTGNDVALTRYLPGGALDATFDGDGVVTTAIGPGDNNDTLAGVALQPDGKIVAAGVAPTGASNTNADFAIARYLPSGLLDAAFDGDGLRTVAIGPGTAGDYARALALQPDGRIVVAGQADTGAASGDDFAVARLIGLEADLALAQDAPSSPTALGSELAYNLTVTNLGIDSAAAATVTYVVPSGAAYDSATPSQGACSGTATIVCDVGALAPGASATVQIVVRPTATGTLNGAFSAGGRYYDPNPVNNAVAGSVTVTNARPDSNIRRIPRGVKARKLKRFSGVASDDYGVAKVQIALFRRAAGVRAAAPRCAWLANNRARFKRARAKRGRCSKPVWLRATGTTRWSFKLKRPLPPGSYVVYSRATDLAGLVERGFSRRDRNRVEFKVIR